MRRLIALLSAMVAFFAIAMMLGTPAWSEEPKYKTVAWTMPSWEVEHNKPIPSWPQTFFAAVGTVTPDMDALDSQLTGCSQWQVDVYKYDTKWQRKQVDALIAGGVLNGPNNPYPEPLVSAKLFKGGPCTSPTPTPTPTPMVTPSPTPSITSTPSPSASEPTPSSTPSDSSPPTPTPTKSVCCDEELPHTGPLAALLGMFLFGVACIVGGTVFYRGARKH